MVVEKNKPFSLHDSICTFCISTWNLDQCTEGHASSEMRTTKLTSTLTTVAYVHSNVNWNWVGPKITTECFQTTRRMRCFVRILANLSLNFHWKVVCPCPGSMEHGSKTCSLACGSAYGCTMLLVAAIIMVKAKHHWNPFVPDTAETTPTATSFCAISIHVFLPRLCPFCVCKSECEHVWQPGFLSSWAACLTKLHKAYFSNRFFAPAKTRLFGATSSNMARSVSISAMLRHLLGTRDTDAESFKHITMMMVSDRILAALWWRHHLACFWKKMPRLLHEKRSVPFSRSKIQLLRTLLCIFHADKTQKVQIWEVIAFICAKLLHDGCAIHNLNLNLGIQSGQMMSNFTWKKMSCPWSTSDVTSWLEQ